MITKKARETEAALCPVGQRLLNYSAFAWDEIVHPLYCDLCWNELRCNQIFTTEGSPAIILVSRRVV